MYFFLQEILVLFLKYDSLSYLTVVVLLNNLLCIIICSFNVWVDEEEEVIEVHLHNKLKQYILVQEQKRYLGKGTNGTLHTGKVGPRYRR